MYKSNIPKYIYIYKPKILAQQQNLPIGSSKAKNIN